MPYRNEYASGDSLWRLVESESVKEFGGVIRRDGPGEAADPPAELAPPRGRNAVSRVIVIDGSSVVSEVRNGYPGAEAALLQIAAVVIDIGALRNLPQGTIPRPSAIRAMEDPQTLDAVLPGRNVVRAGVTGDTPEQFFRHTVYETLAGRRVDDDHETLLETMRAITPPRSFQCPDEDCGERILVDAGTMERRCSHHVFETDGLRLHERFEDYGSSAQAYTAMRQVVEHLVLVNIMRYFERTARWNVFRSTAFVMDGPLAIFGMPAWLKDHVGREVERLHERALANGGPGVLLFGVEKSGQFLDHLGALDRSDGEGPRGRLASGLALAPIARTPIATSPCARWTPSRTAS